MASTDMFLLALMSSLLARAKYSVTRAWWPRDTALSRKTSSTLSSGSTAGKSRSSQLSSRSGRKDRPEADVGSTDILDRQTRDDTTAENCGISSLSPLNPLDSLAGCVRFQCQVWDFENF